MLFVYVDVVDSSIFRELLIFSESSYSENEFFRQCKNIRL